MVTQEEHMNDLEDWKKSQTHVPTYGYGSHGPSFFAGQSNGYGSHGPSFFAGQPNGYGSHGPSFFAGQPNPNTGMVPPEKRYPYYCGDQPPKPVTSTGPHYLNVCSSKDGININLNFFLRLLGASKEVIDDDQKTLEFMMDIKKRLDEANGVTTTGGEPNEHEHEHEHED